MGTNTEVGQIRLRWPWWRCGVAGLSLLALTLSGYLGWHELAGGAMIGCGGGSPCDLVLSSRWSTVAGAPVIGLAAGVYLAILMASFFVGATTEASVRQLAWRSMLVLVGAVAGSAAWFIVVQKWIVGSICPYCMATHVTGLLLAALVLRQASRQLEPAEKPQRKVIDRMPPVGIALAGVGLAGIMAIAQMTIRPPSLYYGGEALAAAPDVDPHNAPLIGSPDAPFLVTLLFDYNCPHCQQLHLMLDEAVRRYRGNLAFILCPTPLNTRCNPYIPRDVDEFKDSCELAKLALAVWVAEPSAFPDFDRWMFSFESGDRWRPRSLAAAKAKAVAVVGQAKFDAALTDPRVGRYLQAAIQIYGPTTRGGNNAVPKLVRGSHWVIPQPNSPEDLISMLRDELGLPTPKAKGRN